MRFQFDEKPKVEICGKFYDCDPSDSGLIAGVVRDFPRLLQLGAEFSDMDEEAKSAMRNPNLHENYASKVQEKNDEILQTCKSFIEGCLGVEEYEEIFSGRKQNSAEHLSLCTYLFKHIMGEREAIIADYLEDENVIDNTADDHIGQENRHGLQKVAKIWKRVGLGRSC